MPERPAPPTVPPRHINTGPGRILIALYVVFAIAATGRSILQLVTAADKAPLAYWLSAVAGVIYIAASICLIVGDRARPVAILACSIELVGVVGIGALSLARPDLFPDRTVWSHFGQGYGFLPLVLPVIALVWLLRRRPAPAG